MRLQSGSASRIDGGGFDFKEKPGADSATPGPKAARQDIAGAPSRGITSCCTWWSAERGASKAQPETPEAAQRSRKELDIQRAMEFIERNHTREFSVAELAAHVGVDRSHLSHLFKLVMNSSPSSCLASFRIRKACELLAGGELSVKEAAYSVGFRDPLFFSRTFKRIKGVSPLEFKRRGMS